MKRGTAGSGGRAGFMLIEILIYLVIAVVLVAAIFQVVVGQNRLYSKQRELTDVRSTLRAAAEVLGVELRMSSAGDGDISMITSDSITLRSVMGSGVVCAKASNGRLLGLYAASGDFAATADDSVMIYAGGAGVWVLTTVKVVYAAGGGGVSTCSWGGVTTEAVLAVDTADGTLVTGVGVGAELRAFRHVTYGTFQDTDGRWWLGRKVGAATGYERLAGPLLPPADSGLAFYYYDLNGDTTSVIPNVALVEILLRGESLKSVRRPGGSPTPQTDTLRTRVALRG